VRRSGRSYTLAITTTLRNLGTTRIPARTIVTFAVVNNTRLAQTKYMAALPPPPGRGSQRPLSFQIWLSASQYGAYRGTDLGGIADAGNQITEVDEQNNFVSVPIP